MNVQDHLSLIRMHAHDLQKVFGTRPGGRSSEIRSMLWGILDRVMQMENELLGGGYGDLIKDGTEERPVG
jgi:hypothetical protein